eukprot:4566740-Pleurochrysis_carterae.AAC.1
MNKDGHIEWPSNYSTKGQAMLRKLARMKLKVMLDDPSYPVDPAKRVALQEGSSGVLALRASPNDLASI